MTAPLFTVPKDTIRTGPPVSRFPNGSYFGTAAAFRIREGTKHPDWRGFEIELTNITTRDGANSVATAEGGTFNIGNRRKWFTISVAGTSERALEIGAQQMVSLGLALGIATENGNGEITLPGNSLDEVLANFTSVAGTRVGFSIVNKPGTDQHGNATIEDRVSSVWAPQTA